MKDSPFRLAPDTGAWVWVVGGGILQMPLIREVRRRGYRALVTDRDPDAPGMKLADFPLEISTYDIDQHVHFARAIGESNLRHLSPIAAVLTAGADVGPTVSAVAAVLDLPAEDLQAALRARNKGLMRRAVGLDRPTYHMMPFDQADPIRAWHRTADERGAESYPCVVKPLEESGSRGLSVVRGPGELRPAMLHAQAADRRGHDFCLVEEKLTGPEVALDFFTVAGKLVYANGAWRWFAPDRPGLELGHVNPWTPTREAFDEVTALAQLAAERLNVSWGPFKADFLRDERHGWCLLETATRLSGGLDHNCTAVHARGVDITGAMLDLALGLGLDEDKLRDKKHGYACAYAPILEPGKVKEWHLPWDEPGVVDVVVARPDEIPALESCAARPVFVVTEAATSWRAMIQARRAAGKVRVEYEGGT